MSFKKGYFILISIILFFLITYFLLFLISRNYLLPRLLKGIGIKEIKKIEISPLFSRVNLVEGKGDFLNFQKAEIEFYPLAIFKRKIVIEKFVLEKLEIKIDGKREEREEKREREAIFVLPLFLKEVEIKNLIFQDINLKREKLVLKNLKIDLTGILKNGKITGEIRELTGEICYDKHDYHFTILKTELKLDNEEFLLANLNLNVKNSLLYGEVIYNLKEKEWQIKIDSSFLNLKDLTNYEGKGEIKGALAIKENRCNGEINIFFKKAKILKELADIKGKLNFLDSLVSYRLEGKISGSLFETKGKFNLKDFSYNLVTEIFNLEKLLPFKIEKGRLLITGKKLSLVDFKFDLSFLDEKIDYLKGEGSFRDKKVFIKSLVGKGKDISFSLKGELGKEKILVAAEINKFSLEIVNNFLPQEIKGIIKGKGEIIYAQKAFSINGDWQVEDGSFKNLNFSFKNLNFSGNLSLRERVAFNGIIDLKELKTPYFSFDTLKLRSSLKDFQITSFFNNSSLKINGSLLSDRKDSLLVSLEEINFLFNGNCFRNEKPVIIGIKENSFKLENFNLKYGEGELVFNLEREKNILRLESELKTLALENFFLIRKKIKNFSGKVNSRVSLTYDLKNGRLNNFLLDAKIFNFCFQELSFDSLAGDFSLAGETIVIKKFSLFKEGKDSEISGFLLFDFLKKELVSQNLVIDLVDFPSEIIFFIPDILIAKGGKITGRINLAGNLRTPEMQGRAKLSGGELILKIPETKIKNISAEIIFSERKIIFNQILGKVKDGEVFANGFIQFREFFKVDTLYKAIRFNNLPITYARDFIGVVTGHTSLALDSRNYLKIVGEAEIKEGLITIPFGVKREGERKELDTLLELDLTFKGERNIWLRNKNADIELGVDFNLKLKKGRFIYSGKINTRQGYLYYLGRSLQLKEGEIIFENISNFDPKISLIGFLTTKPITYQNRKERFKIFLEVSGYLTNPNFNLSSEPPYLSQEEIISYLGLSFTPEELKNWEEKDIFLDILQDRILSYFEKETSERLRKYIGLDYFRLESSFRGEPYLKVSVGKYLGERLYFSYTHSFIEEKQDVFRAEYYLNKNNQIIGERNEFGKTVIKYLFFFRF